MQEYRNLPPVPFRARPDARDPVAVWQLSRQDDHLFYAVNRERYPVQVTLDLKTEGPVRRLSTGGLAGVSDGRLAFQLEPYQLLAFQAPAGTEISKASTIIPEADRKLVESMVSSLRALARDVDSGKVTLEDEGKKLLRQSLEEAIRCVKEGRFWRARTLMEHHRLTELVYNKTLVFPPTLEHLADPAAAKALRAIRRPDR